MPETISEIIKGGKPWNKGVRKVFKRLINTYTTAQVSNAILYRGGVFRG
jgi:hypothetical protein